VAGPRCTPPAKRQSAAALGHAQDSVNVQAFVPQPGVERLDVDVVRVLDRPAGPDELGRRAVLTATAPAALRAVAGKRDDTDLPSHGLVRGSFVAPEPVQATLRRTDSWLLRSDSVDILAPAARRVRRRMENELGGFGQRGPR
jgi:hypothetical protein